MHRQKTAPCKNSACAHTKKIKRLSDVEFPKQGFRLFLDQEASTWWYDTFRNDIPKIAQWLVFYPAQLGSTRKLVCFDFCEEREQHADISWPPRSLPYMVLIFLYKQCSLKVGADFQKLYDFCGEMRENLDGYHMQKLLLQEAHTLWLLWRERTCWHLMTFRVTMVLIFMKNSVLWSRSSMTSVERWERI